MSKDLIARCRERLPLPELMKAIGDGAFARKSCRSPFREEQRASFSVYEQGERWFWKDHATGEHGDEVTYLERKYSLAAKAAIERYAELSGVAGKNPNSKFQTPNKSQSSKSKSPINDAGDGAPSDSKQDSKSGQPPCEDSAPVRKKLGRLVRVYDYLTISGELLHQTLRFEPKDFRQRRPSHEGEVCGGATARFDRESGRWWLWTLAGIEPVLFNLPALTVADLAEPVLVVEGEKDAEALIELGLLATTVPMGAGKWRDSYSLALRGRVVVALCDNDEAGRKHGERVCVELQGAAARVGMVALGEGWGECPPKGDVSDWLVAQAADGEHQADWRAEILSWTRRAKLPPLLLYSETWKEGSSGGLKLMEAKLAVIVARENRLKFVAERFWQYGGGVWTDVPPLTAHQLVHDAMQTLAPLRELQTDKNVKAVVSLMKTEAARGMTLEVFDRHDRFLLNVRNGMLDVQAGTLTEHREDFYSTNQLPVEFVPGATCPLWLEWLAETQPDADIQTQLQEIFGYCLVPGNDYQKFFVFFGDGGSGKSTVLEVLKLLMGRHNTVPLPLLDLDEGFTRSMMVGRLLYDAGELTANSFKHIDLIKTISAGEEVLVEEKYKTPYSFRPQGKIVGTSNVFLKTPDGSMGLFRRLVQVPFTRPRPVESQRRNYHETFIAELPGIFVWAIEGYRRLLGRGYFAQSVAGAELSAALSLHVNTVKTFLACCFEEREGGGTTADLIFADYREWCEFEAVNPYFKENIGLMREIYKHHPEWKKQQKFRRTDQGTIRTIAGVSERFGWRDKYGAELEQRPF